MINYVVARIMWIKIVDTWSGKKVDYFCSPMTKLRGSWFFLPAPCERTVRLQNDNISTGET